jgi:hypothetical protein
MESNIVEKMEAIEKKYQKYYLVNLAFRWAQELRRKKGKNMVLSELVDEAIAGVVSGDITEEYIKNLPSEDEMLVSGEDQITLGQVPEEALPKPDEDEDERVSKPKKKDDKKKKKK